MRTLRCPICRGIVTARRTKPCQVPFEIGVLVFSLRATDSIIPEDVLPRHSAQRIVTARNEVGIRIATMKKTARAISIAVAAAVLVSSTIGAQRHGRNASIVPVVELTIPQMQMAMAQGRVSSRQLVTQYLI